MIADGFGVGYIIGKDWAAVFISGFEVDCILLKTRFLNTFFRTKEPDQMSLLRRYSKSGSLCVVQLNLKWQRNQADRLMEVIFFIEHTVFTHILQNKVSF